MEISNEKIKELQECLRSTCKILQRVMYGVRFDGVFQNELTRPLAHSGKLIFEIDAMIKNSEKPTINEKTD